MAKSDNNPMQRTQQFLSYYVEGQKRIYGYILSVVSNWSDADDIMQETCSLMWQKYDEFQPGTSFHAWGIQVAKYKICEFRRKERKQMDLSERVVEGLMDRAETYYEDIDARFEALERCIRKLRANDNGLIQMRYAENLTIKDMALRLGRSIHGLYKVMARIHADLVICMRRSLSVESTE